MMPSLLSSVNVTKVTVTAVSSTWHQHIAAMQFLLQPHSYEPHTAVRLHHYITSVINLEEAENVLFHQLYIIDMTCYKATTVTSYFNV